MLNYGKVLSKIKYGFVTTLILMCVVYVSYNNSGDHDKVINMKGDHGFHGYNNVTSLRWKINETSVIRRIVDVIPSNKESSGNKQHELVLSPNRRTFKILFWTGAWYQHPEKHWFGEGYEPFKTCSYSNCMATTNVTEYNSSDAILFHMSFLRDFPEYRFPHQKWIMHQRESPQFQLGYQKYNGLFNTTWTYNCRISDICTNSSQDNQGGLFVKQAQPKAELVNFNYTKGKTKLIAWFVSNCSPGWVSSGRTNYVKELQKYISVDVYGSCGPLECDRSTRKECFHMVEKDYKFYLSFENSLCDSYLTEKLWNALIIDVVPIVLGGYDYSKFFLPKSYIDVKDFSSPEKLADYLHMLDKNDGLYNEYLHWKTWYAIVPHPPIQCNLCEYLNKAENVSKVYDMLDLFWDSKTQCHSPHEFYKGIDKDVWTGDAMY